MFLPLSDFQYCSSRLFFRVFQNLSSRSRNDKNQLPHLRKNTVLNRVFIIG